MITTVDLRQDKQAQRARKRPIVHDVAIAQARGICETLEGNVPYGVRDAIITGLAGEQWPVSQNFLQSSYDAVPPTVFGCSGSYRKKPLEVLVKRLNEKTVVPVANGQATLTGHAGDWLVQHGPQQWGIVEQSIFAETYDVID